MVHKLANCTDVTSAVYHNIRFCVASEVLKYAVMSSAKGSKADSGAQKRLRKKKTLELIKSLDGSLYKHFVTTRDPQPSTSPVVTSRPINPSRESLDAHAGAADQFSLARWGVDVLIRYHEKSAQHIQAACMSMAGHGNTPKIMPDY